MIEWKFMGFNGDLVVTWRFPKMAVITKIIHFNGIFYYKRSFLGYNPLWKAEHMSHAHMPHISHRNHKN